MIKILVHSQVSAFTIGFTLFHSSSRPGSGSVTDPYQVDLVPDTARPMVLKGNGPIHSIVSVRVSTRPYVIQNQASALMQDPKIVTLKQLFYMDRELTVRSIIYVHSSNIDIDTHWALSHVRTVQDTGKRSEPRLSEEVCFVVPDANYHTGNHLLEETIAPQSATTGRPLSVSSTLVLPSGWLVQEISNGIHEVHKRTRLLRSVEDVVDNEFSNWEENEAGVRTLSDLSLSI